MDYRNGGATWNFPNGTTGLVKFRFRVADGEQADDSGLQVSLTDRLFNACDSTTKDYALFTFPIRLRPAPHLLLGMKKCLSRPERGMKFPFFGRVGRPWCLWTERRPER